MSTYTNDAAYVGPPTEGNCVTLNTSNVHASYIIPDRFRGRWITVTAIDQPLDLVFGDDSVEVQYGAQNSVVSNAIALNDVIGGHFPAGLPLDFRFPEVDEERRDAAGVVAKITRFAIEAAGSGKVNLRLSHRNV